MNIDTYLIDPRTGKTLSAGTHPLDDVEELTIEERLELAEVAAEEDEIAEGHYLFVTVDFESAILFSDRVWVEPEQTWTVVNANRDQPEPLPR